MEKYLENTEIINWNHPEVQRIAKKLKDICSDELTLAKNCFEWVRDNIKHSWDYKMNPVTTKASDVLKYQTGYCYAKSHLLAAILRANNIPAGFCYQRLSIEDNGIRYCLHGLNAVYLSEYGWYRIDARGNKEDVNAQFIPPIEQLAFNPKGELEADLPEIWSEPLPIVISALEKYSDYMEVYDHFPDVELIQSQV